MNINFGIITPLGYKIKGKREKNLAISERALEVVDRICSNRTTPGSAEPPPSCANGA
jgi:folate-dependent tRNA-U54 methylase TrmFO/GidA